MTDDTGKLDQKKYAEYFLMFWMCAIIAHCDSRQHFGLELFVTCLSYWYLIANRSTTLLVLCLACQILSLWQEMPLADNHWVFTAFVNLALLAALWSSKSPISSRTVVDAFATLRWLCVVMYGLASFHKLNIGFFDPQKSCAITHGEAILLQFGWIHSSPSLLAQAGIAIPISIFLLELGVAVLLSGRRTWLFGIGLGVLFHLSTHMRNFGSIMFALYFLFIPQEIALKMLSGVEDFLKRHFHITLRALLIGQATIYSVTATVTGNGLLPRELWKYFLFFWMGVMAVLMLSLIRASWSQKTTTRLTPTIPRGIWNIILSVVFVANAFSPYLGLKSTTSLSMWSNLDTRKESANHLVMRHLDLKLFDYVDIEDIEHSKRKFNQIEKKIIAIHGGPSGHCQW